MLLRQKNKCISQKLSELKIKKAKATLLLQLQAIALLQDLTCKKLCHVPNCKLDWFSTKRNFYIFCVCMR